MIKRPLWKKISVLTGLLLSAAAQNFCAEGMVGSTVSEDVKQQASRLLSQATS